jgi:hypothetical protein
MSTTANGIIGTKLQINKWYTFKYGYGSKHAKYYGIFRDNENIFFYLFAFVIQIKYFNEIQEHVTFLPLLKDEYEKKTFYQALIGNSDVLLPDLDFKETKEKQILTLEIFLNDFDNFISVIDTRIEDIKEIIIFLGKKKDFLLVEEIENFEIQKKNIEFTKVLLTNKIQEIKDEKTNTKKYPPKSKEEFIKEFNSSYIRLLYNLIFSFFNFLHSNSNKPHYATLSSYASELDDLSFEQNSKKTKKQIFNKLYEISLKKHENQSKTAKRQNHPPQKNLNSSTDSGNFRTICPDPSICFAFGIESENIKLFFNDFDFAYIQYDQIKKIGNSDNGYIVEIPFKRDEYEMSTVLKFIPTNYKYHNNDPDSLYYEAFVGTFVNKWNKRFPCFLETYKMFQITPELKNALENAENAKIEENILLNGLLNVGTVNVQEQQTFLQKENINISCEKFENICILIQHLKDSKTIEEFFKDKTNINLKEDKEIKYFISVELVIYLYQIYSCLDILKNDFTHWDLHKKNVLVFDLTKNENQYIKMIYHYKDNQKVIFFTRYVSKIIDYGSSFVQSSEEMFNIIKNPSDAPMCNRNKIKNGYKKFYNDRKVNKNPLQKNRSYDLALGSLLYHMIKNTKLQNKQIQQILKFVYFDQKTFTEQNQNVSYLHEALKNLILKEKYFKYKNEKHFQQKQQIGEMNIYLEETDKPMTFVFTNTS